MSHLIRHWNGYAIQQRGNGFINATAMCVANDKLIADWFRKQDTIELLVALAEDLELPVNHGISHDSSISRISAAYPDLVVSRRGSPTNGGGTWIHPDLAVPLAQWCNPRFAIQVSRWTQELLTTGNVSIQSQSSPQLALDTQVKLEVDLIQSVLTASGIDAKLVAGVALNHAGFRLPEMRQAVNEAHALLAALTPSELLLTPTAIGEKLGISARQVNLLLLDIGYQVKNLKKSKDEPAYFPTDIGLPYASNTLSTGKLYENSADNTTYQHLKWKSQVVDILREQMVEA